MSRKFTTKNVRRSAVLTSSSPSPLLRRLADCLVCHYCSEYLADSFTHQKCQHTVCGLCSAKRREEPFCIACKEAPALGGPLMAISLVNGRNELVDNMARMLDGEGYEERVDVIKETDLSAHLTALRPPAALHRAAAVAASSPPPPIYKQIQRQLRDDDGEGLRGIYNFWTTPSAFCCLGSVCCGCFIHPIAYLMIALLKKMRKCVALLAILVVLGVTIGLVQMAFTGDARVETILAQLFPSYFITVPGGAASSNVTAEKKPPPPPITAFNLSDLL